MATIHVSGFAEPRLRPQTEQTAGDPPAAFALHLEKTAKAVTVRVQGRLTFGRLGALKAMFNQVWQHEADEIVIDLAACPFVDSSGVAALVLARERARGLGRGFLLVGLSEQVSSLLRLTHLDGVFAKRNSSGN